MIKIRTSFSSGTNKLFLYLSIVLLLNSCHSLFWPEPINTIFRVSVNNDLDYQVIVESNFPCLNDDRYRATAFFNESRERIDPDSTAMIAHCLFMGKPTSSDKEIIDYILDYFPEASYSFYKVINGEKGELILTIPFNNYFNAPMEWLQFGNTYYVDFARTASDLLQNVK